MRRARTGGEWIRAALAAAVVALGAWAGADVGKSWCEDRTLFARYPELRSADADLGREAWLALGGRTDELAALFPRPPAQSDGTPPIDGDPQDVALALFRHLVEHTRRVQGEWYVVVGNVSDDASLEKEAVWVREHPTPAADAVLLRLVKDRSLDERIRRKAAIALARPGNAAGLDALADVACDCRDDPDLRERILVRLPRFELPPPARLHALLDLPCRPGPSFAAAALMLAGDAEAPSLVVETLRAFRPGNGRGERGWVAAMALARLVAADDDALAKRLRDSAEKCRYSHPPEIDVKRSDLHDDMVRLADDVGEWLAPHPEASDTVFERGRRAYLASDRRRRELDTPSVVEITGDDFDLGCALLRMDGSTPYVTELEGLDRLARLVKRDAGPSPTPERWIEAMNARVFATPGVWESEEAKSHLASVMWGAAGNCMGFSSLYLAVARRLDLPMHGVNSPQHVFVRWDDGVVRRNIECTEDGIEHPDSWYVNRGDGLSIDPADVASGAFLSNITDSRFLGLALVNRANSHLESAHSDRALVCAEAAVRLAPGEPMARVARARVLLEDGLGTAAEALADLTAAESARCASTAETGLRAELYLRAGDASGALRLVDRALAAEPNNEDYRAVRVRALCRCGRTRDAERELATMQWSGTYVSLARVELACLAGGSAWREVLAKEAPEPKRAFGLHANLAAELLDGIGPRPPSAEDARFVLDRVSGFGHSLDRNLEAMQRLADVYGSLGAVMQQNEIGFPARRVYYRLTARCCRLEGDEAGAAAAEAAGRQ